MKNKEEVKELLEEIKSEHHSARHFCYAYKLGTSGEEYRANDDGEPSGSAGKPILGQLTRFDLTHTLIVVVRYYGGTKLGVGGLINAYKSAAAMSLENAEIIEKTLTKFIQLQFPYTLLKEVEKLIRKTGVNVITRDFQSNCKMTFEVRIGKYDEIIKAFSSINGTTVS